MAVFEFLSNHLFVFIISFLYLLNCFTHSSMTHMSITTRKKPPADVRMVFINNEQSPQNRLLVVSGCGGGCGCWCCGLFLCFFYFDFLSRCFFLFLPPLSISVISVSARALLLRELFVVVVGGTGTFFNHLSI